MDQENEPAIGRLCGEAVCRVVNGLAHVALCQQRLEALGACLAELDHIPFEDMHQGHALRGPDQIRVRAWQAVTQHTLPYLS